MKDHQKIVWCRKLIDIIDYFHIVLLCYRMKLVLIVGECKIKNNEPITNYEVETNKKKKVRNYAQKKLGKKVANMAEDIIQLIMDFAKQLQSDQRQNARD